MVRQELDDRVSSELLGALQNTVFFAETVQSTYSDDYEVVCPYYAMGCRSVCQRSHLNSHLAGTTFDLRHTTYNIRLPILWTTQPSF